MGWDSIGGRLKAFLKESLRLGLSFKPLRCMGQDLQTEGTIGPGASSPILPFIPAMACPKRTLVAPESPIGWSHSWCEAMVT
jgi:hypothetical protein